MTKEITLNVSELKQFVRYEIPLEIVKEKPEIEECTVHCSEPYYFTLEDLAIALRNIQKVNPTIYNFHIYWYAPIELLSEYIRFKSEENDSEYDNLKLTDFDYFDEIWNDFDCLCQYFDDEQLICDIYDFDSVLEELARYQSNIGKDITEWVFSDIEKENYISNFDSEDYVNQANENQIILARKFIDELCQKENEMALHIKTYSCYGGNRLYDCNWMIARDYAALLFEITDNPIYANTLGYIYYYGRCNDGIPEYNQAFSYFEISAANGIYEGMYKLADMYLNGKGCKKSENTAHSLYNMVYQDCLNKFLKGYDTNFADAALRMGNIHEEEEAYFYYLQADYAAKIRAKDSSFFGDTTVVLNTQKTIDRIKSELPDDYFTDYIEQDEPYYFKELASHNNRCSLSYRFENGWIKLCAKRLPTQSCPKPDSILVTLPELEYCQRTNEFSYLCKVDRLWFKGHSDTIKFDFCEWNSGENWFEFYYEREFVGYIKSDSYRINKPTSTNKSGKKYRFVNVSFSNNQRTYDYLCDIEDISVGDQVIVLGYDGETVVTVNAIYSKYASELHIPIKRFKKVLKKV